MRKLVLLAALLFFTGHAAHAISRVQSCENAQAATSSTSCTLSSNVVSGHALIVYCRTSFANTVSSITDSLGNTFTSQVTWSQSTSPGNTGGLFYVLSSAGGSDTITCNTSGTGNPMIVAAEYSGLSSVDQHNNAIASSSTAGNSGNVTTTSANELLFAGCGTSVSSGTITYTAGSGYSMIATDTQFLRLGAVEDQIVSVTGTYAGTMTFGTANNWGCAIGTFAASAAASAKPIQRTYAY